MAITLDQIVVFFLIFSRFIGLVGTSPFFSNKQIFSVGKMALVFWTCGLLIFVVPLPDFIPQSPMSFVLLLILEFLIGAFMGFTADLMVSAIEMAGAIMDTQAGLSVASLLDPSTGRNAALFELLLKWVALIIFIQVDGHHMVLTALNTSFTLLPVGVPVDLARGSQYILSLGTHLFLSAVKLSAPILLVIFLVDFSFGVLNRIAEQINVFQLGFQIKPMVSIVIFLGMAPNLMAIIVNMMEDVMTSLVLLMSHLQGFS
jgi:flagellar biosynthetic protein FliR